MNEQTPAPAPPPRSFQVEADEVHVVARVMALEEPIGGVSQSFNFVRSFVRFVCLVELEREKERWTDRDIQRGGASLRYPEGEVVRSTHQRYWW